MDTSRSVEARDQVLRVLDLEVAAVSAGDIEAYLGILDDDAVFMTPNTRQKRGDELRQWLPEFLSLNRAEWLSYEHGETVVVEDLAYHTFAYTRRITPKSSAAAELGNGKGIHILRPNAEGSWKLTREIWNSSPAPAQR